MQARVGFIPRGSTTTISAGSFWQCGIKTNPMPEERSGKKVVIIGLAKPLNEMLEKKKCKTSCKGNFHQ